MGQKVNPLSLRLGYIKDWESKWFAHSKDYAAYLVEDVLVRRFIKKNLISAAVSKIEIERATDKIRIIIHTARPGVIIGRKGAEIDRLREELQKMTKQKNEIFIDIKEIKNPAIEAQLVAENIAFQLEKRVAFRRAMKRAIQQAMSSGALGIKLSCSGRLGGAEMSRKEGYREGKIPLQTLRADIEYGFTEALTTYGLIGVKCWVYKGDVLTEKENKQNGLDAQEGKIPQGAARD